MPRENLINWHLEGSIAWSDDSSSVTFEFNEARLTLSSNHEHQSSCTSRRGAGHADSTANALAAKGSQPVYSHER